MRVEDGFPMSEALYRKYRPQIFEDVVGQEHIERTIKNAIGQDKVSHAYLFTGPRGTGKTTTARLLAKALLCEKGPTAEPDGTCSDCVAIANGEHPDVYELDAASRTGVENVREEIIGRVQFAPTRGRYKVYIIDEVHMLSTAAFNALLKTLEEPPSHVVFILATTDPQKVPETIHSRCQRFDFRRISAEAIVSRLGAVCVAEGVEFEGEALDLIAHRAEGGMRNALTSLEQLIAFGEGKVTMEVAERLLGSLDSSDLAAIVRAIGTRDVASCFRWTAEYVETGADLAQFVRDLAEHMRNMYVLALAGDDVALEVGESVRRELADELPLFGPDRLARMLGVLGDVSAELKTSTNPRLSFEIALTRMVRPDSDLTLESLAERIEALEAGHSAVAHVVSVPAGGAAPRGGAAAVGTGGVAAGAMSTDNMVGGVGAGEVPAAGAAAVGAGTPAAGGAASAAAAHVAAGDAPAAAAAAESAPVAAKQAVSAAAPVAAQPAAAMQPSAAAPAPASSASPTTFVSASPEPSVSSGGASTSVGAHVAAGAADASAPSAAGGVPAPVTAGAPSANLLASLQNPAALQRMWQAALATLKKNKAAYGVLFLNTKAVYRPEQSGIAVEFPAENTFAFKAVQKPEVQDALAEALRQACGEPLAFALVQAGTSGQFSPAAAQAATQAGAVGQASVQAAVQPAARPDAAAATPAAQAAMQPQASASVQPAAQQQAAQAAATHAAQPAAQPQQQAAQQQAAQVAASSASLASAQPQARQAGEPASSAGAYDDVPPYDDYDMPPYDDEPYGYEDYAPAPADAVDATTSVTPFSASANAQAASGRAQGVGAQPQVEGAAVNARMQGADAASRGAQPQAAGASAGVQPQGAPAAAGGAATASAPVSGGAFSAAGAPGSAGAEPADLEALLVTSFGDGVVVEEVRD